MDSTIWRMLVEILLPHMPNLEGENFDYDGEVTGRIRDVVLDIARKRYGLEPRALYPSLTADGFNDDETFTEDEDRWPGYQPSQGDGHGSCGED